MKFLNQPPYGKVVKVQYISEALAHYYIQHIPHYLPLWV